MSAKRGRARRLARNVRQGRLQRTLSGLTAVSALSLGVEVYLEHYRGSFGDKWMWTPIALTPPLVAAGLAGAFSERAAQGALPLASAAFALNGVVGVLTHIRGVARRPGGFQEPLYNLVMGPPVLAPGSLTMVGGLGLLAAGLRRER